MNCLTKCEVTELCKQNGLELAGARFEWGQRSEIKLIVFKIPEISRRQAVLAKMIMDGAGEWSKLLVLVTGWGIWPTEENM